MELKNNLYVNGKKLTAFKKDGGRRYRITKDGSKLRWCEINSREIECSDCRKKVSLAQFIKKRHFEKKYFCDSCRVSGERNPFYGKTHSEESIKKILKNRNKDYSGENNPMYNTHPYDAMVNKHGKEKAEKMWSNKKKTHSEKNSGKGNPFYGKSHDEETLVKISEANKKYWNNLSLEDHLERNNLSVEDLKTIFKFYTSDRGTINAVQDKFDIDFRTVEKYWIKSDIVEEDQLQKIKDRKKFQSNPSAKEEKMYEYLSKEFSEDEIQCQFKIEGYCYDFLIGDQFLIEYDGYYWHEIYDGENDKIKDRTAEENGYEIYRVKEDKERNVEYKKEIKRIKDFVSEF